MGTSGNPCDGRQATLCLWTGRDYGDIALESARSRGALLLEFTVMIVNKPARNASLSHTVGPSPLEWLLQLPVMDLHQGSNEYNPLRTKPVTAAMKQDQKHIESSVYDPSTGKTVVSSGRCTARVCCLHKRRFLFFASVGGTRRLFFPTLARGLGPV